MARHRKKVPEDWDGSGLAAQVTEEEATQKPAPRSNDEAVPMGVLKPPAQTRIVAIANQKGGVGKTTTAVNLAAALALDGMNVVLVDVDAQGNASSALGHRLTESLSIYDVITNKVTLKDCLLEVERLPRLKLVRYSPDMVFLELQIGSVENREWILNQAIKEFLATSEERIDYIIFDCPPSLNLATLNVFTAANEVLIPVQAEYMPLEGMTQLFNSIDLVRNELNPRLRVSAIVLTMVDSRTNLGKAVVKNVRETYPDLVLDTVISRTVRIAEAPSHEESIITFDPKSSGSLAYHELAWEFAGRGSVADE